MNSTPPTKIEKKRKRKVLLSTSVKKELVKVIHTTMVDDELRLLKKFREEAASPPPMRISVDGKKLLEEHVTNAWKKDKIKTIVRDLKEEYTFNASKSMVLDTLSTCANVASWCSDANIVEEKIIHTLTMYKHRVKSHLNSMKEGKNNSSKELKFMLQYWGLIAGITVRNG